MGKLADGTVFDEFGALSFVTDDGADPADTGVPEGLELAVMKMKRGEVALVEVAAERGFGNGAAVTRGKGVAVPPGSRLTYEVTLTDFTNAKESWEMSDAEKVEEAGRRKEKGKCQANRSYFCLPSATVSNRESELVGLSLGSQPLGRSSALLCPVAWRSKGGRIRRAAFSGVLLPPVRHRRMSSSAERYKLCLPLRLAVVTMFSLLSTNLTHSRAHGSRFTTLPTYRQATLRTRPAPCPAP